jgi:hypothetical protein
VELALLTNVIANAKKTVKYAKKHMLSIKKHDISPKALAKAQLEA